MRNTSFSAFFGGGTESRVRMVPDVLTNDGEALAATYKGGAAGRYVTRKLSFTNQGVDPKSPAYHGRFTANAELKAYFGAHLSFALVTDPEIDLTIMDNPTVVSPENRNMIHGTITGFQGWRHGSWLYGNPWTAANKVQVMAR